MKTLLILPAFLLPGFAGIAQNVGIGTLLPAARLHVADGSVVFTGPATLPVTAGSVPVGGAGTRMLWYADKGAFRAGGLESAAIYADYWSRTNIGNYSFASGSNTLASGENAVAMGYLSRAVGFAAIALGQNAYATSEAVALGTSQATNYYAAAMSGGAASGEGSTAIGYLAKAIADYSVVAGRESRATGEYAVALGHGTVARSYLSLSAGGFNDSIISSNRTSWIATDPLFIVGNGYSNTDRSNAMVVYKNANLDIKGFTRLGTPAESAPKIKMKKLTGTTPVSQNSFTFIPHGLNQAKILSISAVVDGNNYLFLPHSPDAGAIYTINTDPNNGGGSIAVGVKTTAQSSFVMGKPIRILITYEE